MIELLQPAKLHIGDFILSFKDITHQMLKDNPNTLVAVNGNSEFIIKLSDFAKCKLSPSSDSAKLSSCVDTFFVISNNHFVEKKSKAPLLMYLL